MKLSKLSLAAIVALGAFTTTASAGSLEEAIKGVDLKGFVRLRIYNQSDEATDERYRFSAPFTFVSPVADNLTAGFTVRAESNTFNGDASGVNSNNTNFGMAKAWFKYATPDYSVRMGRFELGTPWTDPGYAGNRGDGLLAFYTGVQNVTLAAGHFVNTNTGLQDDESLSVAAAIASMGPVTGQLWAASQSNLFDSSIFGQVDAKFGEFKVAGQFNVLTLADVAAGVEDTGTFYGIKAGYAPEGMKFCVGYTANDDDQGIYQLSGDSSAMFKAGKQLYYEYGNAAGAKTFFVTADATFGKFGVGAGYIDSSDIATDGNDGSEFYGQVSYKYAKNFNTALYYSAMDYDSGDNDEIRAEFKYSF